MSWVSCTMFLLSSLGIFFLPFIKTLIVLIRSPPTSKSCTPSFGTLPLLKTSAWWRMTTGWRTTPTMLLCTSRFYVSPMWSPGGWHVRSWRSLGASLCDQNYLEENPLLEIKLKIITQARIICMAKIRDMITQNRNLQILKIYFSYSNFLLGSEIQVISLHHHYKFKLGTSMQMACEPPVKKSWHCSWTNEVLNRWTCAKTYMLLHV